MAGVLARGPGGRRPPGVTVCALYFALFLLLFSCLSADTCLKVVSSARRSPAHVCARLLAPCFYLSKICFCFCAFLLCGLWLISLLRSQPCICFSAERCAVIPVLALYIVTPPSTRRGPHSALSNARANPQPPENRRARARATRGQCACVSLHHLHNGTIGSFIYVNIPT